MPNPTLAERIAEKLDAESAFDEHTDKYEVAPLIQSILDELPVRVVACELGSGCKMRGLGKAGLFHLNMNGGNAKELHGQFECSGTLSDLIER